MVYDWTDAAIETIRQMWQDGKSGSQIARDLGGGLTRNAIIGRIHRSGFQARPTRPLMGALTHRAPATPKPRLQLPSPHRQPSALMASRVEAAEKRAARLVCEAAPTEGKIAFVNLEPHHCKWPYGSGPFLFCGDRRDGKSPYCVAHSKAAFEPARRKEAA
jgi:GcrA cell cycle regulator